MASDEDATNNTPQDIKSAALASFGTSFKKSDQEKQKEAEIAALKKRKKKKTKDAGELFQAMSANSKKSEQERIKEQEMQALKKKKKKKITSAQELWSNDASATTSPRATKQQRRNTADELMNLRKPRKGSVHRKGSAPKRDMGFLKKDKAEETSKQGAEAKNELQAIRSRGQSRDMGFLVISEEKSAQGSETRQEMEALKKPKKQKKSMDFLTMQKGPSSQGKEALNDIKKMAQKKVASADKTFLTKKRGPSKQGAKSRKEMKNLKSKNDMLSRFRTEAGKKKVSKQGAIANRDRARLAANEDDQLAYLEGDAVFDQLARLLARPSLKRRITTLMTTELVVKPHQGHYNGFTQKAYLSLVNTPYSTATPQQHGRKVSAVLRDKQAKDLPWRHVIYIFKSKKALSEFTTGMAKYPYHKGKCRECVLGNTMTDLYIPLTKARIEILPKGDPRLVERDAASKLPPHEFFLTIPDPEEPGEAPDQRFNFLAYSDQDRELWVNAIKQAVVDDENTIASEAMEKSRPQRLKDNVNSLQSKIGTAARRRLMLSGWRIIQFSHSIIPSTLERVEFFHNQEVFHRTQKTLRRHRKGFDGGVRFRRTKESLRTCQSCIGSRMVRENYRDAQMRRDWPRDSVRRKIFEDQLRLYTNRFHARRLRGEYRERRDACLAAQAAWRTAMQVPRFVDKLHKFKKQKRDRRVAADREKWHNADRIWEQERERAIEQWAKNAARGTTFHKYPATSKGAPAERGVAVVGGRNGTVVWFKPGKPVPQGLSSSAKNCFQVSAVKDVTHGRRSAAFKQNTKGKHSEGLCFTIDYGTRTLDLAAKSKADYDLWMNAFNIILNRDKKPDKGPDPDTLIPKVRVPYMPPPVSRPTDI